MWYLCGDLVLQMLNHFVIQLSFDCDIFVPPKTSSHTHECNFGTQSVISTRMSVFYTRMSLFYTRMSLFYTRMSVFYTRRGRCWHVWVWVWLWHSQNWLWHSYVSKPHSACRNHSCVWFSHAYCEITHARFQNFNFSKFNFSKFQFFKISIFQNSIFQISIFQNFNFSKLKFFGNFLYGISIFAIISVNMHNIHDRNTGHHFFQFVNLVEKFHNFSLKIFNSFFFID
jgi:hypothetical protein